MSGSPNRAYLDGGSIKGMPPRPEEQAMSSSYNIADAKTKLKAAPVGTGKASSGEASSGDSAVASLRSNLKTVENSQVQIEMNSEPPKLRPEVRVEPVNGASLPSAAAEEEMDMAAALLQGVAADHLERTGLKAPAAPATSAASAKSSEAERDAAADLIRQIAAEHVSRAIIERAVGPKTPEPPKTPQTTGIGNWLGGLFTGEKGAKP